MLDNERLSILESKAVKLDLIEDKVTSIQISVAKMEHQLDNITDHIDRHINVDSKRLDHIEDYVLVQKAKSEQILKLWSRVAAVITTIATIVAIYINLKGGR